MRVLTLQEMVAAMNGRLYGEIASPGVTGVSTDTRELREGAMFFAIAGPNFDGHEFVDEAIERGASAAVVNDVARVSETHRSCGKVIEVDDTVVALGKLAGWYRRQTAAQVIAVFGSNGKTTTKDMIAAALGSAFNGRAAHASYNNAIGVPLTLLSTNPADEFVVVEVGTNQPGEIAALARIVRPDLAVVTGIGEEHLEGLGDLAGVAREEFSFLPAMQARGFIAMSEQARRYAPNRMSQSCSALTYGFGNDADLRAEGLRVNANGLQFRVNGRFDYKLSLLGRHNVLNALAAIAIGTRFRLDHDQIAAALGSIEAPPMRLERSDCGTLTIVNDAYNANPASMRAAFDAMDQLQEARRKVFILGDMRELGTQAARCHQLVGHDAGSSTANVIISVGTWARITADGATAVSGTSKRIYSYPSPDVLLEKLPRLLEPGDIVLLKASRGVRLEGLLPGIEKIGMQSMTQQSSVKSTRKPKQAIPTSGKTEP